MKISIINSICVKNDAISNNIVDQMKWLKDAGHEVVLFTYKCEYPELNFQEVNDVSDMLANKYFHSCDKVIFHYGIFYPLFDILPIVHKQTKKYVVFHNVTPIELVTETSKNLINNSIRQIANMEFADYVICDSQTNLDVLKKYGIKTESSILPISVPILLSPPNEKPSQIDGVIRICFIGRAVKAKGIEDLVIALNKVIKETTTRIKFTAISNTSFSDMNLISYMNYNLGELAQVSDNFEYEFLADASNELRDVVLVNSDILLLPSYHEGFCVPILEAMQAGCKVVSYTNSNIPNISGGLATLVETGDINKLSIALRNEIGFVSSQRWQTNYEIYCKNVKYHMQHYDSRQIKMKFTTLIEN